MRGAGGMAACAAAPTRPLLDCGTHAVPVPGFGTEPACWGSFVAGRVGGGYP
jgi:hypothetical protein